MAEISCVYFDEGIRAFELGKSRDANPYQNSRRSAELHKMDRWWDGYDQAQESSCEDDGEESY